MELLLLSNSRSDAGYLAHALDTIRSTAGSGRRALFVPFAGVTVAWDDYADKVRAALSDTGLAIEPIHRALDPLRAVGEAEVILVGGGNTFHLLRECRARDLLQPIVARVRAGAPYIGWSAGANLACPTICTTNDMPIVDPQGVDALGLIPLQINPHYTNALPPGHHGETRNERIAEYLKANPDATVLGLPEGDWVRVSGAAATLHGPRPALLFRAGQEPAELAPGRPLPRSVFRRRG